jgi:hypothetical protein
MGTVDRGLRGFVAAPVAIVLALLLGAGTIAGIILFVVAGIMVVTATTAVCPTYTLIGISTGLGGVHRTGHGVLHGHA